MFRNAIRSGMLKTRCSVNDFTIAPTRLKMTGRRRLQSKAQRQPWPERLTLSQGTSIPYGRARRLPSRIILRDINRLGRSLALPSGGSGIPDGTALNTLYKHSEQWV